LRHPHRTELLLEIEALTEKALDAADGPVDHLAELVADRGRRLAALDPSEASTEDDKRIVSNIAELDHRLLRAWALRRDEIAHQLRRLNGGRTAAPAVARLVSESA
jgi:hypothetical protein